MGEITFDVRQVREGNFYPQALEKGLRSERALTLSLAEMYVQGVSTRKVVAIVEQLCGSGVSSSQGSKATAQLDEKLTQWRNSPICLDLDARYEKVRQDGQIRDAAVLIAVGVGPDGKRKVLGEQEVHWRAFMESLLKRGLRGVKLIISDDHAGLKPFGSPFSVGCPSSAASFTSSKTRKPAFHAKKCRPKWRRISAPSSTPPTGSTAKSNDARAWSASSPTKRLACDGLVPF